MFLCQLDSLLLADQAVRVVVLRLVEQRSLLVGCGQLRHDGLKSVFRLGGARLCVQLPQACDSVVRVLQSVRAELIREML